MAEKFDWTKSVAREAGLKRSFHAKARNVLKKVAEEIGLAPGTYEVRSNTGGSAVSGEITLHGDHVYVQVSQSLSGPDRSILVRACKGREDYSGGRNEHLPIRLMSDPEALATRVLQAVPSAKLGRMAYLDDVVVPFAEKENWHRDANVVYSLAQDCWIQGEVRMIERVSFEVTAEGPGAERDVDVCVRDLLEALRAVEIADGVGKLARPVSLSNMGVPVTVQGDTISIPRPTGAANGEHVQVRAVAGPAFVGGDEAGVYRDFLAKTFAGDFVVDSKLGYDAVAAAAEGWGIFDTGTPSAPCWSLQRDDEADVFPTDEAVWEHVWRQFDQGSGNHTDALLFLKSNQPDEYERVLVHVAAVHSLPAPRP